VIGDLGMKVKFLALVVAVPVIVVLAAAGWSSVAGKGSGQQDRLVLHGNVDIRQVELAFNASERIDRVLVREGETVVKGQPLAVLDTQRLRYAVQQARAQVAAQRYVVARYEAGSRLEEIRKANADMEAAKVDVANAQSHHARQLDLVAKHFVSQQQADNVKFTLDAAQARLNSAHETLRLVVLGPRREDTQAAKANLAAYEAALALTERDLAQGFLYAPADGVIENRILEPGDMASPQKPAFTLALTDPLWVRAYVPEIGLGKIRVGSLAHVSTDSHPERRYRAWVGFISPTAQFTPKSVETEEVRTALVYQVRVFVCAADGELRLGMPATVTIGFDQPAATAGSDPCKSDA